jgi:outer membrane protein assembly factor BamE (lipoprotein component of BamABCDE complex)
MRTTISYMLMTCCLAAAFCTLAFGTTDSWKDLYASVANSSRKARSSEQNQIAPRIVVAKPAPVTQSSSASIPVGGSVSASNSNPSVHEIPLGATRQEVMAMLGQPSTIDNDRWFYGLQTVMFKDDRVVGSVEADLGRALRNLEIQVKNSQSHPTTPASKKSATKSRMSKTSKPRGYRRSSSPTLWEPMFRKFYSDTPLPRSQRHFSRNNGMPGYRDHRYSESNSIFRRR